MAVVGQAQVLVVPTFKGFQRGVSQELEGAGSVAGERGGRSMGDSLAKWGKRGAKVAGTAIAAVATSALVSGFQRLRAIEEAQAKLRGLGHDADSVRAIMDNALASVKGTSFGLGEAATVAAGAVAAGIKPGDELQGVLSSIANSAAAAGVGMDEMGGIFNKVASLGKAQNDALYQVADRGIPIYQALADQLGVTTEEVFKLASQGKISFAEFEQAMTTASGTVAAEMGDTFSGSLKNMWAALGRVGANFLSGIFPMFSDAFRGITDLLGGAEAAAAGVGEALGRWTVRGIEVARDVLEQVRTGAQALYDLVVRGDFTSAFREAFGFEEDSGLVDFVLTARDAVIDLAGYLRDTFGPVISGVATSISDALSGTDLGKFRQDVDDFFGALADGIRWVDDNRVALGGLTVAVGAFAATLGVVNAVQQFTTWIRALSVATKLQTVYQWALNSALLANPIGIVIAAVAALVAGLVYFFTQTETGQRVWSAVMDALRTAWDAVWGAIKSGWENYIKPAWDAMTAGISAVGQWFTDVWNRHLKPVWDLLVSTVQRVWTGTLQPVFAAISGAFRTVGDAIRRVWDGWLWPVIDLFGRVIWFLWNGQVRVALWAIQNGWRVLVDAVRALWNNVLKPAWDAVAAAAKWLWERAIRPALDGIKAGWRLLLDGIKLYWTSVLKPVWDAVSAAAKWLWENALKPAFDGIKAGWQVALDAMKVVWDTVLKPVFEAVGDVVGRLKEKFETAVENIGRAWDGLKAKAKAPVRFLIETVVNKGIIGTFNKAAEFFGSAKMSEVPLPRGFAGGGTIPGYAPGRDTVPIMASPGEGILVPEAVRALGGSAGINALNAQFTNRPPTNGPRFAGGGVVGRIWAGLKRVGSTVQDFLEDPVAFVRSGVEGFLSRMEDTALGGMLVEGAKKMTDAAIAKARGLMEAVAGTIEGAYTGPTTGGWVRPGRGRVTSEFGPRWGRMHSGIDLAAGYGSPIFAARAGRVSSRGFHPSWGNNIVLQHDVGKTRYAHLSSFLAGLGQNVAAGQTIGREGSTGNSTGPHLHFEWMPGGGARVNPRRLPIAFDSGGVLQPGLTLAANLTGKPEAIYTAEQDRALQLLAARGADRGRRVTEQNFYGFDAQTEPIARQRARQMLSEESISLAMGIGAEL